MGLDRASTGIPTRARCFGCDYPLHALEGNRCPECGREFEAARPETMNLAGRPIGFYRRLRVFPFWRVVLLVVAYLVLAVFLQRTPDPLPRVWREVPWYALFGIQGLIILLILLRQRYQASFRPPADLYRPAGKRPVVLFLLVVLAHFLTDPRVMFRVSAWVSLPGLNALADEAQERPWPAGQVRSAGLLRVEYVGAAPGVVVLGFPGTKWWIVRTDAGVPAPITPMRPVYSLSRHWCVGDGFQRELERLQLCEIVAMAHGARPLDPRMMPACLELLQQEQLLAMEMMGPRFTYFRQGLRPNDSFDPAARYRMPALSMDAHYGEELRPEMVVLAKFGRAAVPELRKLLTQPAKGAPWRAAGVLALMEKDAAEAVPDLVGLLANSGMADIAAATLGCIGPDAGAAADALCGKLGDSSPETVYSAAAALAMVAPGAELSDASVDAVAKVLSKEYSQSLQVDTRIELVRAVVRLPAPPARLQEAAIEAYRTTRRADGGEGADYWSVSAAQTQGVELIREMALRHPAARPAAARMLLELLLSPGHVWHPARMRIPVVLAEIAPDDPVVTSCLAERVRFYRDASYWRKLLRIYAPSHRLVDDRRLVSDADRYLDDLRGSRVYGNNSDVELWRLAVAEIPWAEGRGGVSVEVQGRVRELACRKLGVADRDELIRQLLEKVVPQRYFSWHPEAATILPILATAPDRAELIVPVIRQRVQRYTQGYDGIYMSSDDALLAMCEAIERLGAVARPLLPDLAEMYIRQGHAFLMHWKDCEGILIRYLTAQREVPAEVLTRVDVAMAGDNEIERDNAARVGAMLGMKLPPEEWLNKLHLKRKLAMECAMLSGWNMPKAIELLNHDDSVDYYNADHRLVMLMQAGRCPPATVELFLLNRLSSAGSEGRLRALDALEQRQPLSGAVGTALKRHADTDPNGLVRQRCRELLQGQATSRPATRPGY